MDLENLQTTEVKEVEQEVQPEVTEEVSKQETQPEKTEVKEEIKSFTQKELDDLIERRLSRQYSSFAKEKEESILAKEKELDEKLKTYESDNEKLAKDIESKQTELTRLRFGIKEDVYDEVQALAQFRMGKDPDLTEEEALNAILGERPEYKENTVRNIGIEIKQEVRDVPEYSDTLLKQFPFLGRK